MGAHLGSLSGWNCSLSHFPERGSFRDRDQLRKLWCVQSGCLVRTVTVVHFIDNHVADSYSSMVQATSQELVRREHQEPACRPHRTGFQTMPQSCRAAVGPIGVRVCDCTVSRNPTLDSICSFSSAGSLDVRVQCTCVCRGSSAEFVVWDTQGFSAKSQLELPAAPLKCSRIKSIAVVAQAELAPFPRFVLRLVRRCHRALFVVALRL